MAKKTRAKFVCQEVTFHGDPANENTSRTYTYRAVWDPALSAENEGFSKATPYGELKMSISNPAAFPEIGKTYYLDFTEAE